MRCDWEHQGAGDRASVAVYNRGNQTLDLLLEIEGANVLFSNSDDTQMLINEFQGNDTIILEIELTEDVDESSFTIVASHVALVSAEVKLDVTVFKGVEERELHSQDGDSLQVHYKVWDADTGELLDEGDLPVTAGDDSNYIDGFGWSAIGLDIGSDRGVIPGVDTGTSHVTLLPPSIAYGGSDGHELQNSWLRFELEVTTFVGV